MAMWATVPEMGIVDGPTEVHKVSVAKELLRERSGTDAKFPSYYLPEAIEAAQRKLAWAIELDVGNH
jgi:acyl-CoA dehydrogenase